MPTSPFTVHKLANGLTIVIEEMPGVRSAAAGFMVRAGARDEVPELAGVSHFLEHMMFKGTSKRTWREITVDFDRMGSNYNAFTSEDRTVYYGWVRSQDLPAQMELLADMIRSAIPRDEFDTEKNVILEEIAMAKDSLEHVAFDFLQERVFDGHPLAWPILGYDKTVSELTRDRMWEYFQRKYVASNIVLAVAGAVDAGEVIAEAEKLCGSWNGGPAESSRKPPQIRTGVDSMKIDRFNQQVVVLTYPAASARDPRAESVGVLSSVLGGDNSRFYWNIIQKGIAPKAGCYFMDYTDSGALLLYAICDPERAEEAANALRTEAEKLTKEGATDEELTRVKNKQRTSVAAEAEVPYHRLTQLFDDLEYHDAPRTVDRVLADLDAVTPQSIADYLSEMPITGEGHLTSVGPRSWP